MKLSVALNDLVHIKSGHLFGYLEDHPEGNISVIQPKDVDEQGRISHDDLFRVILEKPKNSSLLVKNDVILRAKGTNPVTAVIPDVENSLMVTNHYFILRPKSDLVSSEYLAWYLNSQDAKRYFSIYAGISLVPTITKRILSDMQIPVPDLKDQDMIVYVDSLMRKEIEITFELEKTRESLVHNVLLLKAREGNTI